MRYTKGAFMMILLLNKFVELMQTSDLFGNIWYLAVAIIAFSLLRYFKFFSLIDMPEDSKLWLILMFCSIYLAGPVIGVLTIAIIYRTIRFWSMFIELMRPSVDDLPEPEIQ